MNEKSQAAFILSCVTFYLLYSSSGDAAYCSWL